MPKVIIYDTIFEAPSRRLVTSEKHYKYRIAVNTRLLLPGKLEGIGWFTYEIFRRLALRHPEVEWIFLFDRPFASHFVFAENVKPIIIPPQARHPVLWKIWFDYQLPRQFRKLKPDLFISPDGYLSLKSDIPSIAVIHDINFEHHPENIARKARNYFLTYFRKFAMKADRIATVSEYSRKDIAAVYGQSLEKIDLVYNGCGEFFQPLGKEEQKQIRGELCNGSDYFVFIGALNPRKNLEGMLRAYSLYRQSGGEDKFVIIGEKMFWSKELQNQWQNHPFKSDIIFAGRQEGNGLSRILASSRALMFVSHFEGFGIPIVEAFKCEVPVITSNTTSMPEIAGDAALLCTPTNHQEISEAMHKVSGEELRESLIGKGRERAKLFSWENSADMMWNSILKVLNQVTLK